MVPKIEEHLKNTFGKLNVLQKSSQHSDVVYFCTSSHVGTCHMRADQSRLASEVVRFFLDHAGHTEHLD